MHNVWLIARREYVERIRTRGFLITTVMIPLIMGGLLFGSAFVSSKSEPGSPHRRRQLRYPARPRPAVRVATAAVTRPSSAKQPHFTVDAMDIAPQMEATRPSSTRNSIPATSTATSGSLPRPLAPGRSARPTFTFTPRSSEQDYLRSRLPPPSALS